MTSSHGKDWFKPVEPGESRRVEVTFREPVYSQLAKVAEQECRNISDQVRFFVKQGIQSHSQQALCVLWDGVSVREGGESPDKENNARSASNLLSNVSSQKHGDDGVGGESENPPRKKGATKWQKTLPPCLEGFRQPILDFWQEKKGSKSERAWILLTKELAAIHAHLNVGRSPKGHETFLEQLELATANRFQSITLKNFKAFAEGTPGKAQPEETPHPASKVFKASDLNWPAVGDSW